MMNLAILTSGYEWLIVLAVLLLLFGGRKLPELARSMGSSITQFKKGLKDTDGKTAEKRKLDGPSGEADADGDGDPG